MSPAPRPPRAICSPRSTRGRCLLTSPLLLPSVKVRVWAKGALFVWPQPLSPRNQRGRSFPAGDRKCLLC